MFISRYICLFMLYSFAGWIYESIFGVVKTGKWEKRGFLYGPVCPIYGVGATIMTILTDLSRIYGYDLSLLKIFVISFFGSIVLEFGTSYVLEKMFHAVWWDYTEYPFNLEGRVCLFSSFAFGVAGIFTVRFAVPFAESLVYPLNGIVTELLSLLLVSVLVADLTLTVTVLINFDRVVINFEENFNRNMESLVNGTKQKSEIIKNNIISGQKAINNRISLMGEFGKSAIRRIAAFRYADKTQNANIILRILKRK